MSIVYKTIRRDYEYLLTLGSDHDCFEVDASMCYLMEEPTKAKASEMYQTSMACWFHMYLEGRGKFARESHKGLMTKRAHRIARKYGFDE